MGKSNKFNVNYNDYCTLWKTLQGSKDSSCRTITIKHLPSIIITKGLGLWRQVFGAYGMLRKLWQGLRRWRHANSCKMWQTTIKQKMRQTDQLDYHVDMRRVADVSQQAVVLRIEVVVVVFFLSSYAACGSCLCLCPLPFEAAAAPETETETESDSERQGEKKWSDR